MGFQLMARVVSMPAQFIYVVKESDTTWGIWFINPASSLPLSRLSGPFAIPAGGRFPYGLNVYPD